MLVKNLVNNGRAVANQFVISDDHNCIYFQSYASTIIKIDYNTHEIVVYPDYDYSKTTIRHRNNFLNEYGFSCIASTKTLEKALKDGFCFTNWQVRKAA